MHVCMCVVWVYACVWCVCMWFVGVCICMWCVCVWCVCDVSACGVGVSACGVGVPVVCEINVMYQSIYFKTHNIEKQTTQIK